MLNTIKIMREIVLQSDSQLKHLIPVSDMIALDNFIREEDEIKQYE